MPEANNVQTWWVEKQDLHRERGCTYCQSGWPRTERVSSSLRTALCCCPWQDVQRLCQNRYPPAWCPWDTIVHKNTQTLEQKLLESLKGGRKFAFLFWAGHHKIIEKQTGQRLLHQFAVRRMEEKSVEWAELHFASRIHYTEFNNWIKSLSERENEKPFWAFLL